MKNPEDAAPDIWEAVEAVYLHEYGEPRARLEYLRRKLAISDWLLVHPTWRQTPFDELARQWHDVCGVKSAQG